MPGPSTTAPTATCRAEMGAMIDSWRAVARRAHPAARAAAEAQVFAQMVVALDIRMAAGPAPRGALEELRHLAQGITAHAGWFLPDQPGWRAEGSVTGYQAGDRIHLSEALFSRLLAACLDSFAPA